MPVLGGLSRGFPVEGLASQPALGRLGYPHGATFTKYMLTSRQVAAVAAFDALIALAFLFGGSFFPVHGQGAAPTISATYASPAGFSQQVDVWVGIAGHPRTLSQPVAPNTLVEVYVNGILMANSLDYALSGNTLSFTGQAIDGMSPPIVQVVYWVGN